MSKKYIVIGTVLLVVILGGAGGYFLFSRANQTADNEPTVSGLGSNIGLPSTNSKFNDPVVSYEDESGYSFSYPNTLKLKDVTPDDDNFYSSLELSKGTDLTKIDITVGNIDPYKTNKSASLIGSTTIGGITANQYSLNGRIVLTAIDQGVLYVIDSPKDGGFWEDAQNKIVSTFKFAGQVTTTSSGGDSDANTSYEEEVVE